MHRNYYRPQKKPKRRFKPKKAPNTFLTKILFVLGVLLIIIGLGTHFYLKHQIKALQAQKQALLLTNARLSAKISRLKKDPKAYEEIARRKYGLVKENERLIVFR